MNTPGTEPPTGRMVPADEGFRAGELAGLQIDDGLVEQDELTLRDRPAEFGLELDLALRGLLHRRLERDPSDRRPRRARPTLPTGRFAAS